MQEYKNAKEVNFFFFGIFLFQSVKMPSLPCEKSARQFHHFSFPLQLQPFPVIILRCHALSFKCLSSSFLLSSNFFRVHLIEQSRIAGKNGKPAYPLLESRQIRTFPINHPSYQDHPFNNLNFLCSYSNSQVVYLHFLTFYHKPFDILLQITENN